MGTSTSQYQLSPSLLEPINSTIQKSSSANKIPNSDNDPLMMSTSERLDIGTNETGTSSLKSTDGGISATNRQVSVGEGKKQQHLIYKGVTYDGQSNKYSAKVDNVPLGSYHLQSDAAFAYDQGADELSFGGDRNFVSCEEYRKARQNELCLRGISKEIAGSSPDVGKNIEEHIFEYQHSNQGSVSLLTNRGKNCVSEDNGSAEETDLIVGIENPQRQNEDDVTKSIISSLTLCAGKECNTKPIDSLHNSRIQSNIRPSPAITSHRYPHFHSRCTFKGTFQTCGSSTFYAAIKHNQKDYFLGHYQLESDAAHAYDKAAVLCKGPFWIRNFSTTSHYLGSRIQEMMRRGIAMEFTELCDTVDERIQFYLQQITSGFTATAKENNGTKKAIITNKDSASTTTVCAQESREDPAANAHNSSTDESDATLAEISPTLDDLPSISTNPKVNVNRFNTPAASSSTKRPKTSKFIGASYDKKFQKYQSKIFIQRHYYLLGRYLLETDAAFAYDKVVNSFQLKRKVNFDSLDEYKEKRAHEIESSGIKTADSLAVVAAKVQNNLNNVIAKVEAKAQRIDTDCGTDNTGSPLSNSMDLDQETDNELRDQENMDGMADDEVEHLHQSNSNDNHSSASQETAGEGSASNAHNSSTDESDATLAETTLDDQPSTPTNPQVNVNRSNTPAAGASTKMPKSSKFIGASYDKKLQKYQSNIFIQGTKCYLGLYLLETDAAFAYDKVVQSFHLENKRKVNFDSLDEYKEKRAHEIESSGIKTADSLAVVAAKVQNYLNNVIAKVEANAENVDTDHGSNSTESPLSNSIDLEHETDNEFRDQANMDGLADDEESSEEYLHQSNSDDTHPLSDRRTVAAKKQRSTSQFTGVSYDKNSEKYQSKIFIQGHYYHLGLYLLETDAAFAYDRAVQSFHLENKRKVNFDSFDAYKVKREQELEVCGTRAVDGLAAVAAKVHKYLNIAIAKVAANAENIDTDSGSDDTGSSIHDNNMNFSVDDVNIDRLAGVKESGEERLLQSSLRGEKQPSLDLTKLLKRKGEAAFVTSNTIKKAKLCPHDENERATSHQGPSRRLTEDLNAKTEVLEQKWGHLLDEDWRSSGFLELHQENISAILMDMESTDGELESVEVAEKRVEITDITSKYSNDCNKLLGEFGKKRRLPETANAEKKTKRAGVDTGSDISILFHRTPESESGSETETNGTHLHGGKASKNKPTERNTSSIDNITSLSTWSNALKSQEITVKKSGTMHINKEPMNDSLCASPDHEYRHNDTVSTVDKADNAMAMCPVTSIEKSEVAKPKKNNELNKDHRPKTERVVDDQIVNESELIPLKPYQTNHLPFPVGCNVWWGLESCDEGETFSEGIVSEVHFNFITRMLLYKVKSNNSAGDDAVSKKNLFYEENLAYATHSLVYYLSPETPVNQFCGEILYCRANPCGHTNLDKIKTICESLQNERCSLKSKIRDVECIGRINALLSRLDSEVIIDRSILQDTGIGRIVKSISKLLANANDKGAEAATNLIDKWKSQIARPQFYYTLLITVDDNELRIIQDVPSNQVRLRN